ncbi:unnamed protein product, partial [Meganyctiphanes norvegica]
MGRATMNRCRRIAQHVVKVMPVIMGAVTLVLMAVDQGTDINSSYQICNIPCRCFWHPLMAQCIPPTTQYSSDACLGDFGNWTQVEEYCDVGYDGYLAEKCENQESWNPKAFQYPSFCLSSIATIVVPSIVNSTYLLFSLWVGFPSVLRYLGKSDNSCFSSPFIKVTLLVLYILQLLPYTWLVMNFLINVKVWRTGGMEVLDETETRDKASKRSKLIFTILEDTPQLMLHCMFLITSVISSAHAFEPVFDMFGIGSILGVISSAASIALTLTLFNGISDYKAAFIQFLATSLAVGTRALVCASYAITLIRYSPLPWLLLLPPL